MKTLTKIIKIVSILSVVIIIAAVYYSVRSRTGTAKREIKPEEDRFGISSHFKRDWAKNTIWADAQAEVAIYKSQQTINSKVYQYDYTCITVPEMFNKEFNVKTSDVERLDLFPVMRVNASYSIANGAYPVRFVSDAIISQAQPLELRKLTQSSSGLGGIIFKEYQLNDHNEMQLKWYSYRDREGNGERLFEKTLLFEDQLIYSLRCLNFSDSLTFSHPVMESQMSEKLGRTHIYDAEFRVADGGVVKTDQTSYEVWKILVMLDKKKVNEYWFEKNYPNTCVKQITWDGQSFLLNRIVREPLKVDG